jgi:hypothetical protein
MRSGKFRANSAKRTRMLFIILDWILAGMLFDKLAYRGVWGIKCRQSAVNVKIVQHRARHIYIYIYIYIYVTLSNLRAVKVYSSNLMNTQNAERNISARVFSQCA